MRITAMMRAFHIEWRLLVLPCTKFLTTGCCIVRAFYTYDRRREDM